MTLPISHTFNSGRCFVSNQRREILFKIMIDQAKQGSLNLQNKSLSTLPSKQSEFPVSCTCVFCLFERTFFLLHSLFKVLFVFAESKIPCSRCLKSYFHNFQPYSLQMFVVVVMIGTNITLKSTREKKKIRKAQSKENPA